MKRLFTMLTTLVFVLSLAVPVQAWKSGQWDSLRKAFTGAQFSLIPATDDTYDIGSSTKQWKDIYIDGKAYIDDLEATGHTDISPTGAHTSDVIDFSGVSINHTGPNGPTLIRAGTYASPISNSDEDQSGLIRLYTTTDAGGTSYDRGIFVATKTTNTKNVIPIAGLAEVNAVPSGAGPTKIHASEFIAHLNSATAKVAPGGAGAIGDVVGAWLKVTANSGATVASGVVITPLWIDNQLYGNNISAGAEEYGMYVTAGGSVVDAWAGFSTTSVGWDQLLYFDSTAVVQAPVSNNSLKVSLNGTQRYISLTTADDVFADDGSMSIVRTSAITSGEFSAITGRGRSIAVGASTAEVRGVYARGTVNDSLYGGTVTALQTETIAKTGSTVVNLRGIFSSVDSEGTPSSITNLYGGYFRVKTSVAPATDFYAMVLENEIFGGGVVADAALLAKGTGHFVYGIDLNGSLIDTADFRLHNSETIDNETDDMIEFQGSGGADDTDLRIDLDGTYPILDSPTDTTIGINENVIIVGTLPGNVGGFPSGILHVTSVNDTQYSNSVITGHSSYNTNTQLWYLGSSSSSNNNVTLINRQNGSLTFSTNNIDRMTIKAGGDVEFTGAIELGHATDTTIARVGSGDISVEGKGIYRVDGTDVADADVVDSLTITNISQVADISATASEINTPLDGATTTLVEFQQLEAIGATTISANQWAVLGGIAETLASAELDILDGVTGITAAEISGIDDCGTDELFVGGGAGSAPVCTTATGTGAPVRAGSPTFTTNITTPQVTLTGADTSPDAAGELVYDSTIAGLSGGGLRWYDNNSVRVLVDLETDPTDDDFVVTYDAAADGFYMAAAAATGLTGITEATGNDDTVALGAQALDSLTGASGLRNTAVGFDAGTAVTTGDDNVAIGFAALLTETTNDDNTAIGSYALTLQNGGNRNTAVGYGAGKSVTTGDDNTFIGFNAGDAVTTASVLVAIGRDALGASTNSSNNTAVGYAALATLIGGGNSNTALGYQAGTAVTDGDNNVFIGHQAGNLTTTGSTNIIIGSDADAPANSTSNYISIGDAWVGDVSSMTFGTTPVTHAYTVSGDLPSPLATMLLLDGDNDNTVEILDLQNGTIAGQITRLIAAVDIDADDTITINMADTTCTNCPAVVFSTIGESATLAWTGSTWVVTSLPASLD